MATDYLVQEEDDLSKFELEEGGGFIILEESTGAGASSDNVYIPIFKGRRR